jgi:ubiquinone/menaquinone biosynthesis C-methylase UbiE
MRNHPAYTFAHAYSRRAEAYANVIDPTLNAAAEEIVKAAALSKHDRMLDLATGTGAVACAGAHRGASVVGIDVSPGMLETARRISPPRVLFCLANAAALPLGSNAFDVVTCGFSLSHFVDTAPVLAEVRRILRSGGRFVASCWGPNATNPAFDVVQEMLRRHGPTEIQFFKALLDESTWAYAADGSRELREVGFEVVRVVRASLSGRYDSPEAALEWTFAWPSYGETFDRLAPSIQAAVRAEAVAAIDAAGDLDWQCEVNIYDARCGE